MDLSQGTPRRRRLLAIGLALALVGGAGCTVERIVPQSAFSCGSGGPCAPSTTDGGSGADRRSFSDDTGVDPPADAEVPDSGVAAAVLSVDRVDFGRTVVGAVVVLSVRLSNPTGVPVVVAALTPRDMIGGDFTITAPPDPTQIAIAPGQTLAVEVTFRPSAEGRREGAIVLDLCVGGCPASVDLVGFGILDAIACSAMIEFGFVNPGTCALGLVSCTNTSSHAASIEAVALAAGADPAIAVTPLAASVPLGPGAGHDVTVTFCPTGLGSVQASLRIEVAHPEPTRSRIDVLIRGEGGGADIQCGAASIDVGAVPVGASVEQRTTCRNVGSVPMSLRSVALAPGASPAFAVRLESNGNAVMPPTSVRIGEGFDVVFTYQPTIAQTDTATVVLETSDPDSPALRIGAVGSGQQAPGCSLEVAPVALEHGIVIPGLFADAAARLRNVGVGPCAVSIQSAPPVGGVFTVLTPALGRGHLVAPGDSLSIVTRFSPLGDGRFTSALSVATTDPVATRLDFTLGGSGLSAPVEIEPSFLEFGAIPVGCAAAALRRFRVTSYQTTAVDLLAATISSGPYTIESSTTAVRIQPGGHVDFVVGYQPTVSGLDFASLRIELEGLPAIEIPLAGEGSAAAASTALFGPIARPAVDILFVVEDRAQMAAPQARLTDASAGFVRRLAALGADYQIGVTTTDSSPGVAGRLRGATPVVGITTPNAVDVVAANLDVGTAGGSSQGLYAATQAVTNQALLAGANAGFSRPDAELVVIFLTREIDGSPGAAASYLTALGNRPSGVPGAARVFAISGGADGCAGNGVLAPPELRYAAVADLSGGAVFGVCDAAFDDTLRAIADALFARSPVYQLPARPAPGTLVVSVDGRLVPPIGAAGTAWGVSYDPPRVEFTTGNQPSDDASVSMVFDVFCVAPTCGDGMQDIGEQCDDGDASDADACPTTCWTAHCGDGFVRVGLERCDDMNNIPGDGCSATCLEEGCGNGVREAPEECDLGVLNSNATPDGCRTDCRLFFCHDGVDDSNEQCDDGNTDDTDACVDQCADATCGDGHVHTGVEECDDGNLIDNDDCANDCSSNLVTFTVSTRSQSVNLSAEAPLAFNDDDDGFAVVQIGFGFRYLGRQVTTVYVGTNGFIGFNQQGATSLNNLSIPSTASPNEIVAWWWDDLDLGRQISGAPPPQATTSVSGTPGSRVRQFTFRYVPKYDTGDSVVIAQVRLFEFNDIVEVHYGPHLQVGPTATAWSASAGWEAAGGTRGAAILGCTPTCSSNNYPVNTVYRLTPR